jgi:ribosomal protein S27E
MSRCRCRCWLVGSIDVPNSRTAVAQDNLDEFDAFLECGIMAHGFLRLRCAECGHDKLLASSCKRRGFCPSCGARRMSQTAAHLVDQVIPHVPVRAMGLVAADPAAPAAGRAARAGLLPRSGQPWERAC